MTNFLSTELGRFAVHILPTTKFRTRHMSVKLAQPLTRTNVTTTAVLPYLWMEGTNRFPSARALMQRADDLFGSMIGTSLGKRGNRHVVETYASVPDEMSLASAVGLFQEGQALALDLILDQQVNDDRFPAGHVTRELALHQKRIESLFDDKIAFAMERCSAEVCRGLDAALPRLGFVEDLTDVTSADLYQTHRALLEEADVHVYIVGDVKDPAQMQAEITGLLTNRLGSRSAHQLDPMRPLSIDHREVQTIVDHQDVLQGKLNIGFRTGVSYADDSYPSALLMSSILGGFPHSKLFLNVREKESLAYYASSRLDSMSGIMAIQTGIEIDKYDRALEIILEQVEELRRGNISENELVFTKRGLRNQYLQLIDQPTALADIHFNGVLTGVQRDIPSLLAALDAVTVEAVVEVANKVQLDTIYFLRNEEVKAHA